MAASSAILHRRRLREGLVRLGPRATSVVLNAGPGPDGQACVLASAGPTVVNRLSGPTAGFSRRAPPPP